MVDGSLEGLVYFVPAKVNMMAMATSEVRIEARVCSDCGYVDLYADTSKLRKLAK
jgi:hypothetical protein